MTINVTNATPSQIMTVSALKSMAEETGAELSISFKKNGCTIVMVRIQEEESVFSFNTFGQRQARIISLAMMKEDK